jgi:hypothetical protein
METEANPEGESDGSGVRLPRSLNLRVKDLMQHHASPHKKKGHTNQNQYHYRLIRSHKKLPVGTHTYTPYTSNHGVER